MAEEAASRVRQRLRLIKDEPRIALTLRGIRDALPRAKGRQGALSEWALQWLEDLGTVIRSREMMVISVASIGQFLGISRLIAVLPAIRKAVGLARLIP